MQDTVVGKCRTTSPAYLISTPIFAVFVGLSSWGSPGKSESADRGFLASSPKNDANFSGWNTLASIPKNDANFFDRNSSERFPSDT